MPKIEDNETYDINTLPEAFTTRMKQQLWDAFPAFLESYRKPVAGTLRLNTLRMDKEAALALSKEAGLLSSDSSVPWDPDGLYFDPASRPGKNILHEAGFYYMQEASAMLPGRLLDPQPSEKILDLCAAPGGKSVQIGMAMKGLGLLVSNEIHPARAAILSENIERMGIANALVTNEDPARLAARFPFFFDRVLVDAPCSGEGMFRKHPEAALEWSPENVTMCSQRQLMILESAHVMLRPGGRLVYSTCTFSEEENESVIKEFLQRHPEYNPVTTGTDSKSLEASDHSAAFHLANLPSYGVSATAPGCYRIYPHLAPGEGHFAAVMEKGGMGADMEKTTDGINTDDVIKSASGLRTTSDIYEINENRSKGKQKKKRSGKKQTSDAALYKPLYTFFEDTINASCDAPFATAVRSGDTSRLYALGQQIYLLPEGCPAPDGVKVQRPGLHLGTLRNDRFEPSLALARALTSQDVIHYANHLSTDNKTTNDPTGTQNDICKADARCLQDYFAGNTLPATDQKGWTLVCAAGIGIGWGKSSGGIVKNHYPKGLRKQLET
ncbi:MAG: RsmB/NOP family class I SAM-dependent RNA methyltransferase [Lachnospiraceae bacterium]|nr:RsmB/NOP family class I SAM-dependent RNA methyltransferase [Lachnospiraceae bacterium]